MLSNFLYLLFVVICAFFVNIIVLRLYKKKKFIIEALIFYVFFFFAINLIGLNTLDIYEFILYFMFYTSIFISYFFTMIMPFEGSPSLKILELIQKEKNINKTRLYRNFKKTNFFESRFNDLKEKKYFVYKNKSLNLSKKSNILLKFFLYLEKIQRSNGRNG
tara:strand:+ start:472 stop:957 length:486 start_codon:yes stop_codon:yes gene_type:complete